MKEIDCLLIGNNEIDFVEYEKTVRQMGVHSGAYRDLDLNFLRFDNQPFFVSQAFNRFCCSGDEGMKPLKTGDVFNAAIAYLGTYLHRSGLTFDFVNSFSDEKEALAKKLKENHILTIAITTTLYTAAFPILEIIEFIRACGSGARIIVGGPFISTRVRTQNEESLQYLFGSILKADFYVDSPQGETALVNIVKALKNNTPFGEIDNIYYREGRRFIISTRSAENNQLGKNMVDWNLFPGGPAEYVNIRTAISCPFSCAFCGFPERAGKYQAVEVPPIEKELNRLVRVKAVKSVHFVDDTFNVPPERFKQLLRMIIKNRYPFNWHSYFRAQYADDETVRLMKESGCEGVFLGIESGSDKILENMNKKASAADYYRGIELLKKYNIVTFGDFIIGFPGETQETARETVTFIENSGLDFFRTQLWFYEHITPIHRQRDKYSITGESFQWSHASMDWKTACDIIDDIFLTVKHSTWVPQYNFDFDTLLRLLTRGMTLDRVKQFLNAFNGGVKEKFTRPQRKEISYDIIRRIKESCSGEGESGPPFEDGGDSLLESEVDFDF